MADESDFEKVRNFLETAPELTVLEHTIVGDDQVILAHTPEMRVFDRLAADAGKVHCIIPEIRAGGGYFIRYLEMTYFPPLDDVLSPQFEYRLTKWQDMKWDVVTIPLEKLSLFEETAKITNMKLVPGHPVIITGNGAEPFPLHNDNCYTLENLPDSIVYTPGGWKKAINQDVANIEAFDASRRDVEPAK